LLCFALLCSPALSSKYQHQSYFGWFWLET
jgi:hypothetical protein